jgi:hypothetical protein
MFLKSASIFAEHALKISKVSAKFVPVLLRSKPSSLGKNAPINLPDGIS